MTSSEGTRRGHWILLHWCNYLVVMWLVRKWVLLCSTAIFELLVIFPHQLSSLCYDFMFWPLYLALVLLFVNIWCMFGKGLAPWSEVCVLVNSHVEAVLCQEAACAEWWPGLALALQEHSLLKNRTKRMLLARASVTSAKISGQKWAAGQCGSRQWQEWVCHPYARQTSLLRPGCPQKERASRSKWA